MVKHGLLERIRESIALAQEDRALESPAAAQAEFR